MKLSVKDRLVLLGILQDEGNAVTLRLIRELKENLSFTDEEQEFLQFTKDASGTGWSKEHVDYEADIDVSEHTEKIIVQRLKDLERQGKLKMVALDLFDRLCV